MDRISILVETLFFGTIWIIGFAELKKWNERIGWIVLGSVFFGYLWSYWR